MLVDDLKVTARLAHIDLDDASLGAALPAFEQMLDYFAAMMAADEDGALQEPAVSTVDVNSCMGPQALRSDSVNYQLSQNNTPNNPSNNNSNPNPHTLANLNNPNSNDSNSNDRNSNNSNSNYNLQNSLLNSAFDVNGRFIVVPNVL